MSSRTINRLLKQYNKPYVKGEVRSKEYEKMIKRKQALEEKNSAFNWLCYCCYGVNHKRASDIVQKLNLKTMEDLLYLDYDKLTSIDGIGDKMAHRILDTISDDSYDQY